MPNYSEHPYVRPLHYWCTKVIPLIYDDSLSYYEVLNKVTHTLNQVIDIINDELESYIRVQLDKLFIDAFYDSETETIVISGSMEE